MPTKEASKKIDPERMAALRNLPINIKQSLTKEEVESFLHDEVWPESLFDKLKDFIVPRD